MMLTIAVLLSGCSQKTSEVIFQLPEDYAGWFCIVENTSSSSEPKPSNGVAVYDLTATNIIQTSNTHPLSTYASLYVDYPSGARISSIMSAAPGGKMVRALFANSEGRFYYFVGANSGMDAALERAKADAARAFSQSK